MKKKISFVTLVAITSIKAKETVDVLLDCMDKLEFEKVKFISHKKYRNIEKKGIEFGRCLEIKSADEYSDFVFNWLYQYIDTSYALLVQYDSGILHPELWDNKWLNYDYIGAPWLYKQDAYICHDTGEHVRVGNGGFSLRSKRLLEAPQRYNLPLLQERGFYNEDGNLCVYHRKRLLKIGIQYAPIEVASRFSYENLMHENYGVKPFGFHKNKPIKTWEE